MKLIRKFALAYAVTAMSYLAGCSSDVTSEQAQTKSVSSLRTAYNVLGSAGIEERTVARSLEGQRVSSFNTKIFNMGFTSVNADLVTDIVIELGDSPAAQMIKSEGAPVFTYLSPRYTVQRESAGSGRVYPSERRIVLPNGVGSLCNGYYVILSPQNGYRRTWTVTNTVELASSSTGMNAGIWGSNLGAREWRAVDINDVTKNRAPADSKTFRFDHGTRLFNNCYADEATKQAWLAAKR